MGPLLRRAARFLSVTLTLLALCPLVLGQSSDTKPSSAQPQSTAGTPDFAKEALVFESSHTRISYQDDGSSVRELVAVIHVLSQAGVQGLAVLTFPYVSANETVEFDYIRVRKPDGAVVTTPDYNVQDMPSDVTRGAPMYSDLHEKHVTVKALGVGDTLEYLVRYRTVKPQVPGQFWYEYTFPKDVVVKDQEVEIDVPRAKYVKVASPELAPQIKEVGARRIYTWKTANLQRHDVAKNSQITRPQSPKPSIQITTFHNWDEVGRWYGELAHSQVVVTPQIQAKATELTKGATSNDDKIRVIYDFVSSHYHYVSLSFGIGRYQPHAAEDVLENEYGDCKDKHTLLAALLKAAGFDAWPALINSSRKIDPEIPSPGQFDHLITVVPQGGTLLWLDTTPGVAPFGLLMANLRDKQALVMPTDKPASLMTTPANPPFPSVQTFTADGKLSSEGTFTGRMQMLAHGDAEVLYRLLFQQVPEGKWNELVQTFSYASGFIGEVSAVVADDPGKATQKFDFAYDYKREKFGDWDNLRITAPLPPMGIESASTEKNKPEDPVFLGAPGTVSYTARIALPSGYTVKLPSKVDITESYADFHASYEFKDGVFTVKRELKVKQSEVPLTAWDGYQNFAKAVSDDKDSWIELSDGKPKGAVGSSGSNPEADRLFDEGLAALQSRDQVRAEDTFKRLIKLDSQYPYAHSNLGTAYLNQGNVDGGIQELRQEEKLHPDEVYSYRMLAQAMVYKHDNAEAANQLQKILVLDPKDRDAALNLGQMLTNEKKYPEAVEVLEKASALAPDSGALQYRLGFAYIRNGDKEKGLALLQKAVAGEKDSKTSSAEMNSVAYSLIEMNVGLDIAQQYAEKALREQEAASLTAGSGHDGFYSTANLGATWDTVGWIYFRLGQYEKALPYLKSSWLLTQNSEVGDHLGQLYAKMGKKELAAQTYRLAYAAMQPSTSFSAGREALDKIRQHYQDLLGPGANPGSLSTSRRPDGSFSPTPMEELSRMRMVKIASNPQPSGQGTFSVLFSPGKVEEVTQVEGDESAKGMIDRIKAAKFDVEFPDQTPARLVRRGIMSCGGHGCDLTLLPPEDRSLMAAQ